MMKKSEQASTSDYSANYNNQPSSSQEEMTASQSKSNQNQDLHQEIAGQPFSSTKLLVTMFCGCSSSPTTLSSSPTISANGSNGISYRKNCMTRKMPALHSTVWAATTVVAALLTLFSSFMPIHSFNIDVPSVITHRGPSSSMFGFSVAQHRDSNVSWILVGAPTAESVLQPGLRKAGAVYRCSCTQTDSCQQLPFDRQGNNVVEGVQRDDKSNQWFGATVRSSGEDGIVLACAPRYVWFSTNKKRRDPVGTCFVAKDSFTEFVEYSPCRTKHWGYHRQGSCQLGLGGDIDSDGRRLFLGAVGSWYWQGQLYMIDSRKSTRDTPVPFYQFLPPGQVYSQAVGSRPDIRWTKEGPSWDDDSYLGYSVAHGEFTGDRESDVAVGMPRGSNLTGKVVIYSSDLINIQNITGDQIGAYFGYALAVLDIDGDGLDDLVIGAPMYTDFDDPAMKIETGRIYVLYQSGQHHFVKFEGIDGTAHKGRFGLSLASCGDLNKDGFNDFAVGAPYDGLYGRGAVYIYHGSATGVRKESTQVIYGEELPHSVSTFGFSLSGGKDLDGNQYPDLIVGAYESDVVAYFRSKPVVRVKSKLSFPHTANKQINLDEKGCTLRDRTAVTCTQLAICMEYDGVGADDVVDFNVQYSLDAKKAKEPRMFFLDHEGRNVVNETVRLTKKKQLCTSQQVYLKPQIRDKLTSLEAELRYSMRDSRYHDRRELQPVIDVTTSSVEKESISIQKNCGSDNICVPNLIVKANQSDRSFLMGSTDRIWVDVEVANNGEDSYETMLYMTVPQGLSYVRFDHLDRSKDVSILCSAPSPSTNNTLKCDIGNPLPFHSKARLRVYFQPRYGSEIKSSYDFHVVANSSNPEDIHKRGDNILPISFPIRVQTDTKVFGVSQPQPVRHNATFWKKFTEKNSETEIGPEVTHVYEVKCEGPSDIEEAEVRILWPSYTLNGEHFIYLLEQPMVEGPAECDHVDDVNPLALTLQRKNKWLTRRTQELYNERRVVTTGGNLGDYDTEETLIRREQGGFRGTSTGAGGSHRVYTGGHAQGGSISDYDVEESVLRREQGGFRGSSSSSAGGSRRVVTTGHVQGGSVTDYDTEESLLRREHGGSRGTSSSAGDNRRVVTTGHQGGSVTDYETEESLLRREHGGFRGSSSGSRSSSVSTGSGTSSRNPPYPGSPHSGVLVHGAFDVSSGGGSSYEGSRGGSGTSHIRSGGIVDDYSRSGIRHEGGHAGSGDNTGYIRSSGGGGSGYHHQNTSSQHEYRREHSLGTGGSGGYIRTHNYSRSYSSQTEYGRSSSSGGSGDEYQDSYFSNRRNKRASDDELQKEMSCGLTKCVRIRCHIKHFPRNSSVIFSLRGRVFSDTLVQDFNGHSVNVSSKLVTWVTKLPYNVDPTYLPLRKYEIDTTIEELPDLSVPAPIPWWVYFLAALAGVLLLLLIVYIFYKCGFFKRRRHPTGPEAQPLNRY